VFAFEILRVLMIIAIKVKGFRLY